jgi:hypothetical protein
LTTTGNWIYRCLRILGAFNAERRQLQNVQNQPVLFLLADGRDDLYGIQEHVGHIDRNPAAPFEARPNRLRVLPSTQDAL